jgi:hypothetical protein
VNTMEDRLRDAYRAATDTISPDSLPGLGTQIVRSSPPRRRRFRFAMPVATAAATAAAIAVVLSLAPSAPSRPAGASRPAAQLPPYTVVLETNQLLAFNTTSGMVTGIVSTPYGQQFAQVAVDGNDRTFVVATSLTSMSACATSYYRLQLSPTGIPGRLTPLRTLNGSVPAAMSVAGGEFADAVAHCPPAAGSSESGHTVVGSIAVADRRWTFTQTEWVSLYTLALSANARVLAFPMTGDGMVLNTASPSGTVAGASRAAVRVHGVVQSLAISPDGTTLYACSVADRTATLASYDAATGGRIGVLGQWHGSTSTYCDVTLDPSSRYLLAAVETVTVRLGRHIPDRQVVMTAYRLGSPTSLRLSLPLPSAPGWNAIAW